MPDYFCNHTERFHGKAAVSYAWHSVADSWASQSLDVQDSEITDSSLDVVLNNAGVKWSSGEEPYPRSSALCSLFTTWDPNKSRIDIEAAYRCETWLQGFPFSLGFTKGFLRSVDGNHRTAPLHCLGQRPPSTTPLELVNKDRNGVIGERSSSLYTPLKNILQ